MAVGALAARAGLEYGRLDPEFYQPTYLEEEQALATSGKVLGAATLGSVLAKPVRTGRTPRDREFATDDQPVLFIKTDTLRVGRIDFDRCDTIPTRSLTKPDYLVPGEVLVTIIGATHEIVGRAAVYTAGDPAAVTNQNVAVIRTNKRLDPYYLLAFLNSKYGRHQLWRHSRQTEQVNLNCREVERPVVPVCSRPTQSEVGELVQRSLSLTKQARRTLQDAEQALVDELGMANMDLSQRLTYSTALSAAGARHRLDAEHFQPRYDRVTEAVRRYRGGFEPLLTNISALRPSFHPQTQPLATFRYIELADISPSLGIVVNSTEVVGHEAPSRAGRLVRAGDVLVSSVVGSLDRVGLVGHSYEGALASTGFFQFRSSAYDAHYLLVLLRSEIVRLQLERQATGAILTATSRPALENLIIPRVPATARREIAFDARHAHDLHAQSQALLEEATRRVDQVIAQAARHHRA